MCELSHDGGDGDFGLFSAGDETVVEGFQVLDCAERRCWLAIYESSAGHVARPPLSGARSAALAAVVGDGGKADDHGDLFGGELAEFGSRRR